MSIMDRLVYRILRGTQRCYELQKSESYIHSLRVNVKSLAAEQRIITYERRRTEGVTANKLRNHQVNAVRPEARAANLAYAIARGVPRKMVEPTARKLSTWERATLVRRIKQKCALHGVRGVDVEDWFDAEQ